MPGKKNSIIKLGINMLPYTPGGQGGAEVYIRNLVKALSRHTDKLDIIIFVSKRAAGAYRDNTNGYTEVIIPFNLSSRPFRVIAEQTLLPYYAKKHKIDWMFSNYVLPIASSCRHIVNIHDMLYKRHPEWIGSKQKLFYWRLLIPVSIKKATKIFTVSHFSAKDIEKFFPESKGKTIVTTEGINDGIINANSSNSSDIIASLNVKTPYILSAATLGPNKNIPNLIKAFKIINKKQPDLSLVLTGKKGSATTKLSKTIRDLGLSQKVIFVGFVTDQELAALYKNATLHVMPSMFEGFGLSVIESQHFGCPVACSNAASLPEIAGCGGIFFDPNNPEDMANKILLIINDPVVRMELIRKGHDNLHRFSWNRAALDVIEALKPEQYTHTSRL